MLDQAMQSLTSGALPACESICCKIEAIHASNPDVANIRGIMAAQSDQPERAEELFVQAINGAPKRAEFCRNLATLFADQKMVRDAAELYLRAYSLDPHSRQTILGLAKAMTDMREFSRALEKLEPARKKWPNDIDVLMGLYLAYYRLNRFDAAAECIDMVLQINPQHKDAMLAKGHLALASGNTAKAEELSRDVLDLDPENYEAMMGIGFLKKFSDPNDEDLAKLIAVYERTEPESPERQGACFTLARVMESLQRYDDAFAYLQEGNDICHKNSSYDANAELGHLQMIIESYGPDSFQINSGITEQAPVFILGMPRCGSTLTEQILAAHPQVESRGECGHFERALKTLHSPENPLTLERITALSPESWRGIGRQYLDLIATSNADILRITDKTLPNFRYIGAIHCALPNAKIIHVRRHPMDHCLSIYKVALGGALHDYSYTLGELGYYYRMYQRVMEHWRKVLPSGVLYELDYESMVANQEDETRKLLDYCGLPWDASCLQFHKTSNVVQTASIAQVRQGIYGDAVDRWKRYEKHLQPLIKILGTT